MEFDPARLRRGEWIVGAGGVVLLASMFLLQWYGLTAKLAPTASRLGLATSANAWHTLTNLRWLLLVTILCCLALVYFQAARRAPAVPVGFSVIVTALGVITTLALLYRVLINQPGPNSLIDQRAGAYVGLIVAAVITYGGYASMREEGILEQDRPGDVETVRLAGIDGS